jgi:hypothetical protein
LCILHLNKNDGGKTEYRLNGSIANYAFPRSVHLLANDPQQKDRKILEHKKPGNAPCQRDIGFQIKVKKDEKQTPFIEYEADVPDITASQALSGDKKLEDREWYKEECKRLYHDENYTYSQIKEELNLSKGTISNYLKK